MNTSDSGTSSCTSGAYVSVVSDLTFQLYLWRRVERFLLFWFFLSARRERDDSSRNRVMKLRIHVLLHHDFLLTRWLAIYLCRLIQWRTLPGCFSAALGFVLGSLGRWTVLKGSSTRPQDGWCFAVVWVIGAFAWRIGWQFRGWRFGILLRLVTQASMIFPRSWARTTWHFSNLCVCDNHIRE